MGPRKGYPSHPRALSGDAEGFGEKYLPPKFGMRIEMGAGFCPSLKHFIKGGTVWDIKRLWTGVWGRLASSEPLHTEVMGGASSDSPRSGFVMIYTEINTPKPQLSVLCLESEFFACVPLPVGSILRTILQLLS